MSGYIGSKASVTVVSPETDSRYVNVAGDTMTGALTVNGNLTVDTSTLFVDSTNNRVGIGTSPAAPLHVRVATNANFTAQNTGGIVQVQAINDASNAFTQLDLAGNPITLSANGAESVRIDSSGNLLVGKTTTAFGTQGVRLSTVGTVLATSDGNAPAELNRLTSDGTILGLYKDGTTVGSIGTLNADPWMARANGCGVRFITAAWMPTNATGNDSDNVVDLGQPSVRFDDVYATNGTIQTSDRNEKQDIAELDEAEQRVAVAAKGLLRKFRWKSAVAEKGDDARIHFGIIAQDLQAAFEAEGLDAGRYAMFISSTWWEHDGRTYETAEEAPDGATERTRLGVRYPELLAFIIGAM